MRLWVHIAKRIGVWPFSLIPVELLRPLLRAWFAGKAFHQSPPIALRTLFAIEDDARQFLDVAAIRLDKGAHPKHRLTGYHAFFAHKLEQGQTVLDVGCGTGEVSADLAKRAGVKVIGVDCNAEAIAAANLRHMQPELAFHHANILDWTPPSSIDVVILSNILEHIDQRVALLRRLQSFCPAASFLIRVPSIEREWTVPLRTELGLFAYSDPTHYVEYTPETLARELEEAGLFVRQQELRWAEIWVEAKPAL